MMPFFKSVMSFHATDFEHQHDDTNLYPSKMSESLIKKFPRTVLASTEFDVFYTETVKFAKRLRKEGRLDEFVVYPGSVHNFVGLEDTHPIKLDVTKNY